MINFLTRLRRRPRIESRWSYALNDLDRKLEPYVDFDGGFFVEAGANDGVAQSNSLYFSRHRGWRGILIEPVAELARACRKNRPDATVECCALAPLDFSEASIEMRYCNLMSLVRGAMKSDAEELEHVAKGCAVQNIESHMLRVPVKPLSKILDEHAAPPVDFLSLDVEGYELSALRGLDFARHRPRYLLVEARFREEIVEFLCPWYDAVAELSFHDMLFRRRD
jgi:FkbM family methyltransferase